MYKKIFISLLTVSSLVYYQSSSAHNENRNSVDSEAKRKAAEVQQDRDSWDSFMSAVKSQEKKQTADEKPTDHEEHHQRSE